MKFITFFLSILVLSSCGSKMNQKIEASTVIYEAFSRGYYLRVEIKGPKINVLRERETAGEERVSSNSDYEKLSERFQKLDLNKLADYKGPTEKRFYDGAAIANLTVNYQGKTYKTPDFDHGNPPAEIAEFINKIVAFTEK